MIEKVLPLQNVTAAIQIKNNPKIKPIFHGIH